MIASEHCAIMLRATLSPSGLPITSFHLLGEGRDSAHLLSSGSSGEGGKGEVVGREGWREEEGKGRGKIHSKVITAPFIPRL